MPDEVLYLTHPGSLTGVRELASRDRWRAAIARLDLADEDVCGADLRGIDTIVHAAAVIHVRRTADWYRINTEGTIRLATTAKEAGVRRFVFVSSIAAAGKSRRDRPLVEEDEPSPLHHYGRSKLLAERALMTLHEAGRFEIVILRPAMFYGPPVPERHAAMYRRIAHSWMPLVGNGDYQRSLVHIDNLVQLVRRAILAPEAAGKTYFAVDRHAYTTREVVEAMAEALCARPRYVRLPPSVAELAYQVDRALSATGFYVAPVHLLGEAHWHQAASCEKAMRELGYEPTVGLREGMRAAVDWCRTNGMLSAVT